MVKEYCKRCINGDTPICDACTFVERWDGISEPSRYLAEDDANNVTIDLSALIESRVKARKPIPIKWVMKYNQLVCGGNEDGKKQNIL